MIVKTITIKYKPLFKWSRSYDLYILATRMNELIESNNEQEKRLKAIESKIGTAPSSD